MIVSGEYYRSEHQVGPQVVSSGCGSILTGKRKVIGCMKADLGKKYLVTGSQTG